jgi:hypothetical protein
VRRGSCGLLAGVGEVVVEEGLDAAVGGAQAVGQAPTELALAGQDRCCQARGLGVLEPLREREAELGEPQVDAGVLRSGSDGGVLGGSHATSLSLPGSRRHSGKPHQLSRPMPQGSPSPGFIPRRS